ncbi:ectonucleoside triphosphate diphosphohydrolase 8-like isoform X2 [Oppia nitens]|nr:ectonucleoside triphosphate diphosphohydrolase 8-like isoform X2 [Oppia nitens]XP_054167110.1 ectonucleoside triphosphate diphosphohydrolase 8-like isoform X2 [Oppia nitens]
MTNWKVLTLTAVTIGLCGLVLIVTLFTATGGYVPFDYGVVLDAGSSHTQITLYHWLANKMRCTGVVEQLDTCRIEGGISSYNVSDVSTVGYDLLECIRNVSKKIDKDRLYNTPLYLGATAGMRLLNKTDSNKVKSIFYLINNAFIQNTGLQVKTIDIISGQNEGLFSWITSNYLMDKLIVDEFDTKSTTSTTGMLDMGGASAQIAYREADNGLHSNVNDEVNVRLYGINHTVRASSNLCFGADQAMLRYQMYLILLNKDKQTIDSPCHPKSSQINAIGNDLKEQICVKLVNDKIVDYNKNYTFIGTGNNDNCSQILTNHLLNKSECQTTFDMCFDESANPPPNATQFFALSSYYYTVRILKLTQEFIDKVTADEYKNEMQKFCSLDRQSMLKNPLVIAKYVDLYCFQLHYIYTTIKYVYKFADNMWPNIKFTNSIGKTSLGWSLGSMINATNAIAAEKPTPPMVKVFPFILVVIFCSLILFLSIYFAIKWHKQSDNQKKEKYEPISITP